MYPAFAARNLKQLQTLIDVASGHNSIVMGDMNSGPEVADSDVQATFVQSYDYAKSRGFVSPYVDQANAAPDCTFCETNPINEAIFMGLPINKTILDHIFINPQVFEVNADQTKVSFHDMAASPGYFGLLSAGLMSWLLHCDEWETLINCVYG